MLKINAILMSLQIEQVLKNIKLRISTMWTVCGRLSGTFPQYGRLADNRRERFHNVDGLQMTVGNVSTMWTACRRLSGTFPQCGGLADDCRERFHNVEIQIKFEMK
jgi:hypothetical protein